MKYIAYLFKYLNKNTVEQLSNTTKKTTLISRRIKYIPEVSNKYIYIKIIDTWINRFPRLIHCSIEGYDESINDYINLFKHKLIKCNLKYTNVTDVSALGNVHTLDLGFTKVTDVSALGNVHKLDLLGCDNVSDISALGNVHILDLRYTRVKDKICICCKNANANTLKLWRCRYVKDVSMFNNINYSKVI